MGLAREHDPAGSVPVPAVAFKSPSSGPFLASLNPAQIASVPPTLSAPSLYPPLPPAALLLLGTHLACSQATVLAVPTFHTTWLKQTHSCPAPLCTTVLFPSLQPRWWQVLGLVSIFFPGIQAP